MLINKINLFLIWNYSILVHIYKKENTCYKKSTQIIK